MVKLTPKGLSVISRQRAISLVSASGVGIVRAVTMPKPPAFDTASGRHVRSAHPHHAALDNRVFNIEHFGDSGFHNKSI
jgi:hypothetical protein